VILDDVDDDVRASIKPSKKPSWENLGKSVSFFGVVLRLLGVVLISSSLPPVQIFTLQPKWTHLPSLQSNTPLQLQPQAKLAFNSFILGPIRVP